MYFCPATMASITIRKTREAIARAEARQAKNPTAGTAISIAAMHDRIAFVRENGWG